MKQHPCKDCEKRHRGCHSECEEYKEVSKHNKELQEKQAAERGIDEALKWLQTKRMRSFKK